MADALDCVTIGETMLRLDADPAVSLEETLCLTLGAEGAGSFDGERWVSVPAAHSEIVDPIGRGDAFTAGLIYGVLAHDDVAAGMRFGVRLAALKQTYRGDVAWVNPDDLREGAGGILR